jgi:hypothetical protein
MIHKLTVSALLAVSSVGVPVGFADPRVGQQVSSETKTNLDKYEKFYRDTFRENSIEKCVASAPKAAAAGFDITPTCECASDTFVASKTLDQLIKFQMDDAEKSELAAITAECLKKDPPVQKPKGS